MVQAAPASSPARFELSVLFLSRRKLQEMNQSQVLTVRREKPGGHTKRELCRGEGGREEQQQQQIEERRRVLKVDERG